MSGSGRVLILDAGGWSFWGCPCLFEWWPLVQRLAVRRGLVSSKLGVSQGGWNAGGVAASAGTHDGGGVLDLRQYSAPVIRLLREAGAAAWHRTPAQGFAHHTHLVLVGCPHASAGAKRQVASYKAGRNGLAMNGPDDGPQVQLRTWREGVAWMRSQLNPTADAPTTPDSPTPGESTTGEEDFIMAITQKEQADFNALLKAALNDRDIQIKLGQAALGNTYGDVDQDGKPDTAGQAVAYSARVDRVTQDRVNQLLDKMDTVLDRVVAK